MSSISLSSNCKSNEDDIQTLAESIIVIDVKADFLDAQTRCQNVIIDGIPKTEDERWSESEKVLTFFKDELDLNPHTIWLERVQRVGKVSKAADETSSRP